jgi:four helix bundle protein
MSTSSLEILDLLGQGPEGFERRARPQFIDFLGVAEASAGELRSPLYVASDQGYLTHVVGYELCELRVV